MSDDIKNLLEKLTLIEGTITPSSYPKRGLNKQQKQAPQMPALFKPNKISVLSGKDNPQHPAKRFFVGAESKDAYCDACDRLESECICDDKDCDLTRPQTEDVISTVRKGLNDYLHQLSKEMDPNRGLVIKAKDAIQNPELDKFLPVKTILTHDGKQLRIHGNENDGFIVKINERPVSVRFKNLEHAELACEMFCNRRMAVEQDVQNQDYVDED